MKRTLCGLAMLFTACAAPAPPPTPRPPSAPPPPAPRLEVPTVRVSGAVVASDGHRVRGASVIAGSAAFDCVLPAHATGAISDESGQFSLTVEGAASSRCVVVRATSGGVSGEASVPADFSMPAEALPPVEVTVRLNRPAPLTAAEAERLVHLLATAINNPAAAVDELALYVAQRGEALYVAIDLHRQVLGRVAGVDEVAPSVERSSSYEHHTFELRGENGRSLQVDARQEALARLHGLLLDYGWRTERFANAYVRAVASGDAVRLSQILNPGDVDFSVERAREMIAQYRLRYRDTATIRAEFVDVDERRHAFTWRLRGTRADGRERTEDIVLRVGDGLVGVEGL